MKNFQCKNVMRKKKLHPIADQFSDDGMNQIKHFGQMLGGGVTPFDEEVEKELEIRQAAKEANAKKMRVAQTGGGDQSLGPSAMDTRAIKQRGAIQQQATTTGAQAVAQAQAQQSPVNTPPAPSGPQGSNLPRSRLKKGP
jgi:hypothetical protein